MKWVVSDFPLLSFVTVSTLHSLSLTSIVTVCLFAGFGWASVLLYFRICFVIIMFETLDASDFLISASSRLVPLFLFHGKHRGGFLQQGGPREVEKASS